MDYRALIEFVGNGSYHEMKNMELQLDVLKTSIRSYQENTNSKRIEWKTHGVVGKFVATRKYNTDFTSIYEILENHGILHLVLKVNWNSLTEAEQIILLKFITPSTPYLRFVFVGSHHHEITEPDPTDLEQLVILERVRSWKSLKHAHENKLIQWNLIKKQTLLEMLHKKEENVKLSFGKLNVIKPSPQISTIDVYREIGDQALKSVGNIDYTKLNEFVARGFIKKSEVSQFRKTSEIDLRYYLMEIHKEHNYIQTLSEKIRI
ncbi:hypothetical protein PTQ21_28045 [Paenibacillus marchantiae]|uniref:hypothetical protein n=1 Tax=Paenibacillus marchantiae TaxID=3026433 RepID=UPI00237ABBBE|nr:hypothetical protein [Paenibacillus marchantiae]WDQ32188.1 hypothetical protein PTQ21_28045 [Paenibacillus marchantiae]